MRRRPIPGFEKTYLITDCGKVYSLRKKKYIKLRYNSDFYLRAELFEKGVRTWFFVHRLVALVYRKNTDPKNRNEVNHLDWNKENNHYTNLRWDTRSENMLHNRKKWKSKSPYNHAVEKQKHGTPF